jgi:hypothetical protein
VFAIADLSGSRIAFYATVATLLPIIMLAFGFQLSARSILPWSTGRVGTKTAIFVLLLAMVWVIEMAWAELNALASLADDRNENFHWVFGGTLIGFSILWAGVGDAVVNQLLASFKKDHEEDQRAKLEEAVRVKVEEAVQAELERRLREGSTGS